MKQREYESLTIEVGIPSYGYQYGKEAAAPLELQLHITINFDKGCYLGREQVSSMHNNKLCPLGSCIQSYFMMSLLFLLVN